MQASVSTGENIASCTCVDVGDVTAASPVRVALGLHSRRCGCCERLVTQ